MPISGVCRALFLAHSQTLHFSHLHPWTFPGAQYWWPTQGTIGAPGLQYYMRVAAYNDAGFSNWKYYNMNYDNHEPQIVPTKGLVDVEFVITGMLCVYACPESNSFGIYASRTLPLRVPSPCGRKTRET